MDTSTQGGQDGKGQEGDSNIRALREKAKSFDEAIRNVALLERENALLKSGVDLEHPHGQLFARNYAGESTPEAVKAEAAKYGIPVK